MTPGNHIGQYRIVRKLGAGGMGTVYLAEHILLGRQAAIKTLLPALSVHEEIVDRFFNEARATSAIADAGVVQVFDFGYHVDGTAGATLGDTAMPEIADPAATSGRYSGGLVFAASEGDHVSWPVALPAAADVTIELWVKPDAASGARDVIASGDGSVALRASGTGGAVQLTAVVGNKSISSVAVAAGHWHHVVLSLSRPTLRLWVDGLRTEIGGANDTVSLAELRLGGMTPAGYYGVVDEVWVSQAAVTTDDPALQRFCPL